MHSKNYDAVGIDVDFTRICGICSNITSVTRAQKAKSGGNWFWYLGKSAGFIFAYLFWKTWDIN
jgi:hypothetical protein